jgi:hypothetical protein
VIVSYHLYGLGGRQLQTLDPRKMPLHDHRRASAGLTDFGKENTYSVPTLIASSTDLAIDEATRLFGMFTFEAARTQLVDEQRKLLERRW